MQAQPFPDDGRPVAAIFRAPVFNASETFVRLQATSLARYQPLMVGLEDKGHVPPSLEGRVMLARDGAQAFAIRALGRWGTLGARVAAAHPALIHAHFGPDGLAALPLARRLGIPLAVTLHGYDVSRSRTNLLASGHFSWMRYAVSEGRLKRGGDLFLPVSNALRDQAIARGFPAERTFTHYIGIDCERFRPAAGRREDMLILHVGRLVEKKGTEVLLRALPAIRTRVPGARLAICGDGPLRPALEKLAGELGIAGAVEFRGAVPADALPGMFARAALLAAPSVTARSGDAEGLPTVIMEAAASGLPVVASHHGGIGEAVTDGQTGFLVPEHDSAALARRIAELLAAPDLGARFGAAGRTLTETRFDAARQMRLLEQRYDEMRAAGAARS
ncbi:MAG: glycosyltransferase [Novosphingobium sp.]|nr:glycosyltransferase [Novosphingobium sp.]MBO9601518.1 glycosyltransferase [Novosphingobium sp.]